MTPEERADDLDAERRQYAIDLGLIDPDDHADPIYETCPIHGRYIPASIIDAECHACLAELDDWHRHRNSTRHLYSD